MIFFNLHEYVIHAEMSESLKVIKYKRNKMFHKTSGDH